MSTLAGTGERGYTGDGGPAIAATWGAPKAIRCDAAGDVIVVDTENHAIPPHQCRGHRHDNCRRSPWGERRRRSGHGGRTGTPSRLRHRPRRDAVHSRQQQPPRKSGWSVTGILRQSSNAKSRDKTASWRLTARGKDGEPPTTADPSKGRGETPYPFYSVDRHLVCRPLKYPFRPFASSPNLRTGICSCTFHISRPPGLVRTPHSTTPSESRQRDALRKIASIGHNGA